MFQLTIPGASVLSLYKWLTGLSESGLDLSMQEGSSGAFLPRATKKTLAIFCLVLFKFKYLCHKKM